MPGRPINRITPKLPPQAFQTFAISAPKAPHTRKATCEEVECQAYARGWRMTIDLNTELGQKQAWYIKTHAGRAYKKIDARDGVVTLEFASGQPCFTEHRVRNSLPEKFLVKGGDYRGNPLRTVTRVHKRAEFWVEEFAENQDRLATRIERG